MLFKERYYYACEGCGEIISTSKDSGVYIRRVCETTNKLENHCSIPDNGIIISDKFCTIKTKDNNKISNLSKFNLIIDMRSSSYDYNEGIKLIEDNDDKFDVIYKLSKHMKKETKILKTYEFVVDLNAKAKKNKIYLIEDGIILKGYKAKLKEILDGFSINEILNLLDESLSSIYSNMYYRTHTNSKAFLALIENPIIEILSKSGFCINIFSSYNCNTIREELNAEGKNLEEILGVTKSKIKYLKKMFENENFQHNFWTLLTLFQNNKDLEVKDFTNFYEKLSIAENKYKNIVGNNYYYFCPFDEIVNILNLSKKHNIDKKVLLKYICETLPEKQGLFNISNNLKKYVCYLELCEDLEINKIDKYPKSLILEIDRLKYLAILNKQEIMNKKFKRNYDCNVLFDYSSNLKGYKIESPLNITEIKTFANELRNCVASYINRYCDGISKIYFLKDMNNKVIGCLELNSQNILVQALGTCNKRLSVEENKFVATWKKHISELIKENTNVVA